MPHHVTLRKVSAQHIITITWFITEVDSLSWHTYIHLNNFLARILILIRYSEPDLEASGLAI